MFLTFIGSDIINLTSESMYRSFYNMYDNARLLQHSVVLQSDWLKAHLWSTARAPTAHPTHTPIQPPCPSDNDRATNAIVNERLVQPSLALRRVNPVDFMWFSATYPAKAPTVDPTNTGQCLWHQNRHCDIKSQRLFPSNGHSSTNGNSGK